MKSHTSFLLSSWMMAMTITLPYAQECLDNVFCRCPFGRCDLECCCNEYPVGFCDTLATSGCDWELCKLNSTYGGVYDPGCQACISAVGPCFWNTTGPVNAGDGALYDDWTPENCPKQGGKPSGAEGGSGSGGSDGNGGTCDLKQ
eukprot:10081088-Ditylum_brightwellii.AAC.1